MSDINRREVIENLKRKLDELDADISRLEIEARESRAQLNAELQKEIAGFRSAKLRIEQKISDLRSASDSAWKEIASGLRKSRDELSSSVEQAKKRFTGQAD